MEIYVVKPGDTLYRISRQYNVPIASLLNINTIPNPDVLVVGQSLVIPTPATAGGYTEYVVKPGDTLYAIATRFNTTPAVLASINNITNPNLIYPGQVLRVPTGTAQTYVVQRGDTLYAIAQRFGITVAALQAANNITNPNLIYPGQILIIPTAQPAPKSTIETLGFLVVSDPAAMVDIITAVAPNLTYVALFSYPVTATGEITGRISSTVLTSIRANRAAPLAVISNFSGANFDSDLARAVLGNETVRSSLIDNILAFVTSNGLAGVNIDFENMYPEDRQLYNEFIRLLAERLRPAGYIVSIAMAPKYEDWPTRPWVGAFDYATLGRYVDFAVIMTYEWGWVGGPPMAIAPLPLVRRVIEYAETQMPADKIIMGMPLYGYDWRLPDTPENLATTVTLSRVLTLAAQFNSSIQWDQASQTPFMLYTDASGVNHEVWFEDARSQQLKYLLAQELGVRGVSYWQLEYRMPETWYILNQIFNVRKIV